MHSLTMKANHDLAQRYLRRFKRVPKQAKYRAMLVNCTAVLLDSSIIIYFSGGHPDVAMDTLDRWVHKIGLRINRYGWDEREGVRMICEGLK